MNTSELTESLNMLNPMYRATKDFINQAKSLTTSGEPAIPELGETSFDNQLRSLIDSVPITRE